MKAVIQKATDSVLRSMGLTGERYTIERPGDMSHGDYALNVAMVIAKKLGKNPREVAQDIAERLTKKLKKSAKTIDVAGPGFINITIDHSVISAELVRAVKQGQKWGTHTAQKGRRISIEYSCPNPFKEIHLGHLMNTIIGEALARVTENAGARVIRDTYGGDVGPHVAKAIWGLRKLNTLDPVLPKEIGDAYVLGAQAYEESEESKKEIDALNVELYQGKDEALVSLWKKGRSVAQEKFNELYKRLDISFDYIINESEVIEVGMRKVLEGLEKGVFERSDGAVIFRGEKVGLHTLVFITSRGTPTYEAKDIGLAYHKAELVGKTDANYIQTANEQIGHFTVFLAALNELAPDLAKKTTHIPTGLLTLTTGKMASRKGNVVTAENLMDQLVEKAMEKNSDAVVAHNVAMGALKFLILRASLGSNVVFDVEQALSLEGESGPYLQYALVRARSIVTSSRVKASDKNKPATPFIIERLITRYPEVCVYAQQERAPHHIAQYLTQLASAWNAFYAQERIIGDTYEAYKLLVAKAFVQTMSNGLRVLGIPVPDKM